MKQLGILGMGSMGSSIAHGLLKSKEINPDNIIIYDHNAHKVDQFPTFTHASSVEDLFDQSTTLLLAIKPQSIHQLACLASKKHKPLILSIVAGVSLDTLSTLLDNNKIVRAMPSLTAQVHQSFTTLSKTNEVSVTEFEFACHLFSCIGSVYPTTEQTMDSMIAITGSFPAYLAYFLNMFKESAIGQEVQGNVAVDALLQTTKATIELLETQNISFESLIQSVCSPGGITLEGIRTFQDYNLNSVVQAVYEATTNKSKQLTEQTSKVIQETNNPQTP